MNELPPVISQQVFDPEALAAAVHNATFLPCHLSAEISPSTLTRVMCPTVCLDFISLGSSLLFTGKMSDECYTLVFILECEQQKGRAFNFGVNHNGGYMGFFAPGGELDAFTPQGYSNATLSVPIQIFEAAVQRSFPEIPDSVLKNGAGLRISEPEQTQLRSLLAAVKQGSEHSSAPLMNELLRSQLEVDLLDAFLVALQSGCGSPAARPNLRIARRQKKLKQARDFLTGHIHEAVTLTALSEDLEMSERGVEKLFQDSMGIGPNAYIRHQRLHGVRRDLTASLPASGKVKQVALSWGFWHMGHFAREYRSLFGESPSATLLRN